MRLADIRERRYLETETRISRRAGILFSGKIDMLARDVDVDATQFPIEFQNRASALDNSSRRVIFRDDNAVRPSWTRNQVACSRRNGERAWRQREGERKRDGDQEKGSAATWRDYVSGDARHEYSTGV